MTIIELPTYTCTRCGHRWVPRTLNPRHCARCNSPYWDKPRVRNTANKTGKQGEGR